MSRKVIGNCHFLIWGVVVQILCQYQARQICHLDLGSKTCPVLLFCVGTSPRTLLLRCPIHWIPEHSPHSEHRFFSTMRAQWSLDHCAPDHCAPEGSD